MMDKRRNRPSKLNNSGMTLMEILVAVIIFSMVSVVFLRSFVYAFQLNEQAKQKQYSMILAQSLMESVKAYDIVTLDQQFSGAKSSFRVYALGDDGSIDNSPGANPEMHGNQRIYKMKNIVYQKAQFGERYKYDVDISVEPSTDPKHIANLVKAQSVNAYSDAIYIEREDEQSALRDDIKAELAAKGHSGTIATLNTNKISISRTITVEITSAGVVTVKPVYEYSVSNYPITKLDGTTTNVSFTGTVTATDAPFTCYDKTKLDDSVILTNLYIYYYPAYNKSINQLMKCTEDKIQIVNNSSTLRNIYLLKQENPELSQTDIDAAEGSYSPKINVKSTATPASPAPAMNLFHNLERTLHHDTMVAPPPSVTILGNVEDKGVPWNEDTDTTTLLYNVTVTVKKSGESDSICEIVGSTNAK